MSRRALVLPPLSPATTQMLIHCVIVFLAAFGAQMVASTTGDIGSWPAILAVLTSAAAAGVTALVHFLLGLVPTPPTDTSVSLKLPEPISQLLTHLVVVFLTVAGAQFALGAANVLNIHTLTAWVIAACAAGVSAIAHILFGLLPTANTTAAPA